MSLVTLPYVRLSLDGRFCLETLLQENPPGKHTAAPAHSWQDDKPSVPQQPRESHPTDHLSVCEHTFFPSQASR